jgi:hypothetical protein
MAKNAPFHQWNMESAYLVATWLSFSVIHFKFLTFTPNFLTFNSNFLTLGCEKLANGGVK